MLRAHYGMSCLRDFLFVCYSCRFYLFCCLLLHFDGCQGKLLFRFCWRSLQTQGFDHFYSAFSFIVKIIYFVYFLSWFVLLDSCLINFLI